MFLNSRLLITVQWRRRFDTLFFRRDRTVKLKGENHFEDATKDYYMKKKLASILGEFRGFEHLILYHMKVQRKTENTYCQSLVNIGYSTYEKSLL